MIRFACPACQKVLTCQDNGAGRKVACPRCGQRLLIPPPPPMAIPVRVQTKTILGRSLPDPSASLALPSPADKRPVALPAAGHVQVDCPGCRVPLMVPEQHLGRQVQCPKCGLLFATTGGKPSPGPIPSSSDPLPEPTSLHQQPPFDVDSAEQSNQPSRVNHQPSPGRKFVPNPRAGTELLTVLAWCSPASLVVAW